MLRSILHRFNKSEPVVAVASNVETPVRTAPDHVGPRVIDLDVAGLATPSKFFLRGRLDEFRVAECAGERAFLESFVSAIQPDDIVFDLGAQLGLFTISAAKRARQGQVVAFEPDPGLQQVLREHVALNNLPNVLVVPKAVSDSRGRATLFTDGVDGYSPSLRKQDREGACTGQAAVETTSIDDSIEELRLAPDVLKIDIEGAEILALRGMSQLLQGDRRPRTIFIEVHPDFLPAFESSPEECVGILKSAGYDVISTADRLTEAQLIFQRNDRA